MLLLFQYYLQGFVGLLSALVIVAPLNPVHRIALLVLLFLVGSLFYILLDYYFLGLTYIIVYCGAIAILFVFVMIVTITPLANSLFNYLTIILTGGQFQYQYQFHSQITIINLFIPNWTIEFLSLTDIYTLAIMVYLAYPTSFIIISIALWVVMIGIMKLTLSSTTR